MNNEPPYTWFKDYSFLPDSAKLSQLTIAGVVCWVGVDTNRRSNRMFSWYGCFELHQHQALTVGANKKTIVNQLRELIRQAKQTTS